MNVLAFRVVYRVVCRCAAEALVDVVGYDVLPDFLRSVLGVVFTFSPVARVAVRVL